MVELERVLRVAVETAMKEGCSYADARFERRIFFRLRSVDGSLKECSTEELYGLSVRAFYEGAWGYASCKPEVDDCVRAAKKAAKMAKALAETSKSKFKLPELPTRKESVKVAMDINPTGVPLGEKVAFVMEIDRAQRDYDARIVHSFARYEETLFQFAFHNSFGSYIEWEEPRIRVDCFCVSREAGVSESAYKRIGGLGGYEIAKSIDPRLFGTDNASVALQKLFAKSPPKGEMTVILDPEVAGVLAHESFGHAAEADEVFFRRRSFLSGLVGQQIASEHVTIVDDGSVEKAYGSIPFDSEGVPSGRTVLVEKGVLKGYMHSLETAALMGVEPTGNGRAQDFERRVFPRMTNTFFERGDWDPEEMIADTKEGVYAVGMVMGMEDPGGGGFYVLCDHGYVIEKGEKKRMVRRLAVSGKALEVLRNVDAVGKDFLLHPGTCGKGEEDAVPVTSGGPHLRTKALVGGA